MVQGPEERDCLSRKGAKSGPDSGPQFLLCRCSCPTGPSLGSLVEESGWPRGGGTPWRVGVPQGPASQPSLLQASVPHLTQGAGAAGVLQ